MFTTRSEVEAHLHTIRPAALKAALGARETIHLTRRICQDRADDQLAELRRTTLDMIASAKRQEQAFRDALNRGLYD